MYFARGVRAPSRLKLVYRATTNHTPSRAYDLAAGPPLSGRMTPLPPGGGSGGGSYTSDCIDGGHGANNPRGGSRGGERRGEGDEGEGRVVM